MKCPYCHFEDTQVTDSRITENGAAVKRRRKCLQCERRFTTYERIERIGLSVVKRDTRREEYSRDKLRKSLVIASVKRPIRTEELEEAVNEIEAQLFSLGTSEVPSTVIGEMIMQRLRELDEVAYIRFASVYRNFADLEEMREAMEGVTTVHPAEIEPADATTPRKKAKARGRG